MIIFFFNGSEMKGIFVMYVSVLKKVTSQKLPHTKVPWTTHFNTDT